MSYEKAIWKNNYFEKSDEHLFLTVDENNRLAVGSTKTPKKITQTILCVVKNKGFLSRRLKYLNGMTLKSKEVNKRVVDFINLTKDYHLR